MRLVILESPFAGKSKLPKWAPGFVHRVARRIDERRNVRYARRCLHDSIHRGEAPIASHLLYTQPGVLDDGKPSERQLGIDASLAWRQVTQAAVVYIDRGVSLGMEYGVTAAQNAGVPVEYRSLEEKEVRYG